VRVRRTSDGLAVRIPVTEVEHFGTTTWRHWPPKFFPLWSLIKRQLKRQSPGASRGYGLMEHPRVGILRCRNGCVRSETLTQIGRRRIWRNGWADGWGGVAQSLFSIRWFILIEARGANGKCPFWTDPRNVTVSSSWQQHFAEQSRSRLFILFKVKYLQANGIGAKFVCGSSGLLMNFEIGKYAVYF
jgi:hypothetical protein